ncbi:MAG: hypothetical protein H7332_04430 [Bdellovibrionales bacterium]|nr:hypothetical protein [Ramlibacter sp.]
MQQTRRDLRTAIKALLDVEGLQFASSAALSAACERLTRFETDPNKDKLRGLRGLMYTQVSQWLAPHELEALAAASTTPGLRPETYERAESISARASLTSLRLALDVAQKAHLAAPQDAVLKTRYQHRLKQAFCAAELVFDGARQAFQQADQASREAHQSALALFTPESKTNWQISQYVRTLKKDALVQVAADLKKYASLRKLRLEPYCDSLPLGDETMAERRHDAFVQLAYVNAVADACDHLVRTLADRPRLPR